MNAGLLARLLSSETRSRQCLAGANRRGLKDAGDLSVKSLVMAAMRFSAQLARRQ